MKEGVRVLGIDDAPFRHSEEHTFLTGVVYRGTEFIEDIRTLGIDIDANNSSEKVLELYNLCNNPGQIKAILLDGISFAGFNLVDLEKVSGTTGKPVIAVTPNRPDSESFREAMKRSGNYDESFESLPEYRELDLKDGKVFFQFSGCEVEKAEELIRISVIHGQVPEPIRVADMIGRALKD